MYREAVSMSDVSPSTTPSRSGDVLPDISIRQLEYLVAVAEAPTWAAAAATVGVSASALSQGLAELERRVGITLFEPVGRRRILRVTATPVLDHARQVVSLTRDLTEWSDRLRTAQSGRVRLGMIDVAAVVHFPDALRTFRSERPDVSMTLSVAPSRTLLGALQSGRLDLAVCVEPPEPVPGVDTVGLLSEPLVVFGPPGVTIGAPASWGPWVLFPGESHTRRLVTDRLRELGAPIEVAAESHQPDVLREMVLLGLGWTVLPRSQGDTETTGLTVGDQLLKRRLVLAWRHGSVHDPAADDLAARLRRRPAG
jgi:DNA-binding transcriptional LysR family regulator